MTVAFTNGDDLIIPSVAGETYQGQAGNDTYIISNAFTAGDVIKIEDTDGTDIIQLMAGLSITSSTVYADATEFTLNSGAIIRVLGASHFTFDIAGDALGGTVGTLQDYDTFVVDTLGTTVPGPGEAPSTGGAVVIDTTPGELAFELTNDAPVSGALEGADTTFTVTANQDVQADTVVTFTSIVGDAAAADQGTGTTNANDFTATTQNVTILAGTRTAIFTVNGTSDGIEELAEAYSVTAAITGQTTLTNDVNLVDASATTYALTASATSVIEGEAVIYTITASQAVASATDVVFQVVPANAAASDQNSDNETNINDFSGSTLNPVTVTIAAGATTATFSVTGREDNLTETPEDYSLTAVVNGETFTATTSLLDGAGTYTLTTGIDSGADFVGTAYNDTFDATTGALGAATFTSLDALDGGDGDDTLTILQTAAITLAGVAGATVANIETATVGSGATVVLNTSAWTGLTSLSTSSVAGNVVTAAATTDVNATELALSAGAVTITGGKDIAVTTTQATAAGTIGVTGAAGTVTVTANTNVTAGGAGPAITLNGGTTISSTQNITPSSNAANAQTAGAVAITGDATTTAVTANATSAVAATATAGQILNQTVKINDLNAANDVTTTAGTLAGTLTEVSLSGFGAATVSSAALNTVNLSGTGTSLATLEGGSTAATNTALALNLNGVTMTGAITDSDNQFKTININTGATAGVTSTLGAVIVDTALTAVTIAGAGNLVAPLTTVTITSIDASASTGNNTVSVDATTTTYAGGSGDDAVTIAAAPTKATSGGDGSADTLVVNIAVGFNASANTNISNFEILGLGTAANANNYDATGFTGLTVGATAAGPTFTNVAAGADLALTANPTGVVTYTLANNTGLTDSVNVNMMAGTAMTTLVTATGVETVNISAAAATGVAAIMDTITISAAPTAGATSAFNVISGALTGVTLLDTTDLTISTVDASGVQGDGVGGAGTGFVWTSGILAATTVTTATTVTGSANGGDTINMAAAVDLVTIIGAGSGVNALTGSLTNKSTITGGTGADAITGGNLADTITGNGGADNIDGGAGADSITVSGALNTITQSTAGDSGVNTATNTQTAQLTTAMDIITGLVAGDKIDLQAAIGGVLGAAGAAGSVATADLAFAFANLTVTDNDVNFAQGFYDAGAGIFTYAANGTDTALTYDIEGTIATTPIGETIILVGFVADATLTTAAAGVITLG